MAGRYRCTALRVEAAGLAAHVLYLTTTTHLHLTRSVNEKLALAAMSTVTRASAQDMPMHHGPERRQLRQESEPEAQGDLQAKCYIKES